MGMLQQFRKDMRKVSSKIITRRLITTSDKIKQMPPRDRHPKAHYGDQVRPEDEDAYHEGSSGSEDDFTAERGLGVTPAENLRTYKLGLNLIWVQLELIVSLGKSYSPVCDKVVLTLTGPSVVRVFIFGMRPLSMKGFGTTVSPKHHFGLRAYSPNFESSIVPACR